MKNLFLALILIPFLCLGSQISAPGGAGGSGDVAGPATSTDTAIARFNGGTGKTLQNSLVLLNSGKHFKWATDGDGDVGSTDGGTTFFRPNKIWGKQRLQIGDTSISDSPFLRSEGLGDDIGWYKGSGAFTEIFLESLVGGDQIDFLTYDGVDYTVPFSWTFSDSSFVMNGSGVGNAFIYWQSDGEGGIGLGPTSGDGGRPAGVFSAGPTTAETELSCVSAGCVLKIAEGANATMGTATLVAGTVTVATTAVTASSRIFLTCQDPNAGTPGALYVSARTASTSFDITSTSGADTCIVGWHIVEPY